MPFQIVKLIDPINNTAVIIPGGLVPRGAYNAGTDYAVGDSVSYNGSSYVMYVDAAAGTVPTNTTYWMLLAEKGSAGGGAVVFTDLTDVPTTYTGEAGKVVSVKSTEDGLEFTTPSGGATTNLVPYTGASTNLNLGNNFITSIYGMNYQTQSGLTRSATEGVAQWDKKNRCLSIDMMNDSRLQVGQEIYIICYNDTAVTLLNGKPVYQTGVIRYEYDTGLFGDYPTIDYADGSYENRSQALGILTMDIPAYGLGFATALGVVNDIDTSAWVAGDLLYVSEITPGGLTNTKPPVPYFATLIGRVLRVHATAGNILIRPQIPFTTDDVQDRLDNIQSTGLINGGQLTINGTTQFDLGSGIGVVVDNYTAPEDPVKTYVIWDAQAALDPLNIGTEDTTYVYINSSGTVVLDNAWITSSDRRDLIVVGWVDHHNHSTISEVRTEPFYGNDLQAQASDFYESWGSFNIWGNIYSAYSGLQISCSAGETFDNNANYYVSKKNPNILSCVGETIVTFTYYYQSAPGVWVNTSTPTTYIDPDYYDSGSGKVAVTTGYWTIQLISYYANFDTTDIQYGQTEYATLASAKAAIRNPIDINPYNSYDNPRCWLIIKQGATDLTDTLEAIFVPCGRILMADLETGSEIGLAGITDHNDLDNIQGGQTNQRYHIDVTQYNNVTNGIVNSLSFAGNTSGTAAAITGGIIFAGGNNITLSQVGQNITISGPNAGGAQTAISGIGVSNTTYTSGTVIFSNQANVTLNSSVNGGSQYIQISCPASHAQQTGISSIVASDATYTSGSVQFTGSNMITVKSSANQRIVIDATQSIQTQNSVLVNGSSGGMSISGGNNITVGNNASTITISGHAVQTGMSGLSQSQTMYTSGTVIFSEQANITINSSVNGASQYLRFSVGAGGGGGVVVVPNAYATTFSTGSVFFSGLANITINSSVDGASQYVQISAPAPGGGGAAAVKVYEPDQYKSAFAVAQGTVFVRPMHIPYNMTATQLNLLMHISNSANAGGTMSFNIGLYTYSVSTANSISSTLFTKAYNSTLGASSSYTNISGTRYRSISLNSWAFTPGDYLLAIGLSVQTGLTSGTYSRWGGSILSIVGREYSAAGNILSWGFPGIFSSATNAVRASFHISNINRTGASVGAQWWFNLQGTA